MIRDVAMLVKKKMAPHELWIYYTTTFVLLLFFFSVWLVVLKGLM